MQDAYYIANLVMCTTLSSVVICIKYHAITVFSPKLLNYTLHSIVYFVNYSLHSVVYFINYTLHSIVYFVNCTLHSAVYFV